MATTPKRSFPSDHAPSGYTARAIALTTAEAGVRIAELTALILEDQTDGDNNNLRTIRAAAELSELSVHLTHTQWLIADGNLTEAKKSALNMADKREQKP